MPKNLSPPILTLAGALHVMNVGENGVAYLSAEIKDGLLLELRFRNGAFGMGRVLEWRRL